MKRNAKSDITEAQSTKRLKRPMLLFPLMMLMVLMGALAALALPPTGVWPLLGLLAMGFYIARGDGRNRAFFSGFALGFGYFIVALHWIGYAFLVDAEAYLWMMPFAVGGLAAFLSLYWGLAFVAARILMRWRAPWFVAFPFTMAVAEVFRGILFTGFPWAAPGLVADGMGGVLQAASLVGMQGLTFWLLLWASLAVAVVRRGFTSRLEWAMAIACLLALPLVWGWGVLRLESGARDMVPGVRLLLVQPNIPQDEKWQNEFADGIFDRLLRLSTSGTERPTHVIWPESAVPFLIAEDQEAQQRIADVLAEDQILLTGAIRRESGPDGEDYFTSILQFGGDGQLRGQYDKWRLVPGGEFLPFAWILEPLGFRKVVSLPESFTAGQGPRNLDMPLAGPAGALICYEVIFPQSLVDPAQRPAWLVNVTNDGWFGLSTGPHQHLAQARMRAVEQNLPLVRAANTGISGVIDGEGRLTAVARLGVEAALSAPLPVAGPPTLFSQMGLLAALLPALAVLLAFIYSRNKSLIT